MKPARWRRFYGTQAVLLALSALALAWVFHATALDLRLEAPYYDAASHTFPWRRAWISKYFVHRYLKYGLIALGVWVWGVLVAAWLGRGPRWLAGRRRRWATVALSFALVPTVIAVPRHFSTMHCPWDVTDFGGYVAYFDLLSPAPAGAPLGRCFPAGFVTGSSWLLAFALLWYPERPRRALLAGLGLFAFALGMGWVQQMRGAHFPSHTLWSLWLSWLLVLLIHAACQAWREGD